jgi:hypothetical protein
MQNDILASLARLSDHALAAELKNLAVRERDATARMVAHLAEMDTRDIPLRAGYPRLYDYCLSVVHECSQAERRGIYRPRRPTVLRSPPSRAVNDERAVSPVSKPSRKMRSM